MEIFENLAYRQKFQKFRHLPSKPSFRGCGVNSGQLPALMNFAVTVKHERAPTSELFWEV
ncbi:hypothetical protein PILCRDRAFT_507205 [Piloderma croceum F 1598]|uniref:Uncharacterized protein n=1 Tax=Piloderma croceum (strain F 1598) TaxID=765440 RepID=A0A0C3B4Z3_PILCF|nr:hypothetical protein PILCRDRAFT_507205 [Piloderma croceum F 1598]